MFFFFLSENSWEDHPKLDPFLHLKKIPQEAFDRVSCTREHLHEWASFGLRQYTQIQIEEASFPTLAIPNQKINMVSPSSSSFFSLLLFRAELSP